MDRNSAQVPGICPATRNDPANPEVMLSTANGKTMAEIAVALTQELSKELGRIIINKTGIDGRYNITLKWTPESDAADGSTPPDSGPSIFTAIQEQLGLKLESTKGPVQVLIIDHVEMPTEN